MVVLMARVLDNDCEVEDTGDSPARYDDFIARPEEMAAKVLRWAGLQSTSATKKYILTRTTRFPNNQLQLHRWL